MARNHNKRYTLKNYQELDRQYEKFNSCWKKLDQQSLRVAAKDSKTVPKDSVDNYVHREHENLKVVRNGLTSNAMYVKKVIRRREKSGDTAK